MDFRKRPK